MEKKIGVKPISLFLIASLILAACGEVSTAVPHPTSLPVPSSTPFPSPEPLPTFESDPILEYHCAKDPIPENGNITQAVKSILADMGNKIDLHGLMEEGWYIAAGKDKKVLWSDNARNTLTSNVIIPPGSKVCIGRNQRLTEFQIEPPPHEDSLLPPQGRIIFAGLPKGFSPSKRSAPARMS